MVTQKRRQFGLSSEVMRQIEEETQKRAKVTRYDRSRLALAYTRQSTDRQLKYNQESASEQAELEQYAQREPYAWDASRVKLINENLLDRHGNVLDKPRAASGQMDSSLRAGLREGEELIASDKVGIVFVHSVSRLFRDTEMINPPQFARLCKEHGVVIVDYSENIEYDFNATARNDLEDFLEACQDAANYLKWQRKTLLKRQERKGLRGGYTGHTIPCGFMLDAHEKHENYEVNPVWAPVVAQLTRRFRELDADLTALHNEIYGVAIFPELPNDIKERVGRIQLQRVSGGYTIASRTALKWLLINLANIGHKTYTAQNVRKIVKYNAHPAIVDREDFDYAYSHLALVDFDGKPFDGVIIDEHGNATRIEKRTARYTQENSQKREGLLSGVRSNGKPVITSSQGSVYVLQHTGKWKTTYTIKDNHYNGQYSGSVAIDIVDAAISQRLEDKLRELHYHAEESDSLIETVKNKGVSESETPEFQSLESEVNVLEVAAIQERQVSARAILDHVAQLRQQVHMSLGKVDATIADIEQQIAFKQREYAVAKHVMSDKDIEDHFSSLARLRNRLSDLQEKQKQSAKIERDNTGIDSLRTRQE